MTAQRVTPDYGPDPMVTITLVSGENKTQQVKLGKQETVPKRLLWEVPSFGAHSPWVQVTTNTQKPVGMELEVLPLNSVVKYQVW